MTCYVFRITRHIYGDKMSDNLKIIAPQDRKKINVGEYYEVRDWSDKFKVTEDELKDAVKEVGVYADDVEKYLNAKRK